MTWDELPDCELGDFTLATVPARFARIGDPGAGIDEAVGSLDGLAGAVRPAGAGGPGRRAVAAALRQGPGRAAAGHAVAGTRERAATGQPARGRRAVARAGVRPPARALPPSPTGPPHLHQAPDRDRPRGHQGRGAGRLRALEGAPSAVVAATSSRSDVLVDGMRGRFTLWYRIRVNLEHVPEAERPAQEPLEVDYDPWSRFR